MKKKELRETKISPIHHDKYLNNETKKILKIKIPTRLSLITISSLSFSFLVPAILFVGAYLIWDGLFYFLLIIFTIAILYRAFTKEKGIILRESNPEVCNKAKYIVCNF